MDTARPFRSRRSEAVLRDLLIDDPWATLKAGLESFEPGFVIKRHQPEKHAGRLDFFADCVSLEANQANAV